MGGVESDKIMRGALTINGMAVRGGGAHNGETEEIHPIFIVTLNGHIAGRRGLTFDGDFLQGEEGSKRHETRLLLGDGDMMALLSGLTQAMSQHTGRSINDILIDVQARAEKVRFRREKA